MTDFFTFISNLKKEYSLSDQTFHKLEAYVSLLEKWSKTYNLIGPNELSQIWERHIAESLFLTNHLPDPSKNPQIIDLGSGAGFPGIVLALLGYEKVTLVEKTRKKYLFLETVSRETSSLVQIINSRIEDLDSIIKADVVTSRALADLPLLLHYSKNLLSPTGYCLFLKGKSLPEEIGLSEKKYHFNYTVFQPSKKMSPLLLKVTDIIER